MRQHPDYVAEAMQMLFGHLVEDFKRVERVAVAEAWMAEAMMVVMMDQVQGKKSRKRAK